MKTIKQTVEFQWDKGNIGKNKKHLVEDLECEQVFFDKQKITFKDTVHSQKEKRFRIIGKTKKRRLLFVVFTIRGKKIRIISGRDTNKKEVFLYEKKT